MKKTVIIITAFVLFFAVLGYFIWREIITREGTLRSAQTTKEPETPVSTKQDTAIVTQPDFNFARLTGDSLHLYSMPRKSDPTLEAVVVKDELDNDYVKIIAKKGEWYQNEDSLWICNGEITSYYDSINPPYDNISKLELGDHNIARPDEIIDFFPRYAQTLNGEVKVYSDSTLSGRYRLFKTTNNIQIIDRRKEGYHFNNYHVIEVFKVIIVNDNNDSIIGWTKAEDMVINSDNNTPNGTIISGNVGFSYYEPGAIWIPCKFS